MSGRGRILAGAPASAFADKALGPSGGVAMLPNDGKRKAYRRPSTPQETARRKAWGAKWGKINSEHAKQLRKGEG